MRYIRRLLALLLLCLLCVGGYLVYKGYTRYEAALQNMSVEQKAEEVRSNPSFTPLKNLPETYQEAVVAVEDKRFYKHSGIDLMALLRAVKNDIKAGRFVEGGSTITQQLAKNLYFSQERSLTRKIAECFMSFALEKKFTKKEILELYVNSIYFGNGYYCVADASRGYFGKEPEDMNGYESTMLAGIPNAPSVYAPTVNPELTRSRQQKVLDCMVEQNYLTKEEAKEIFSTVPRGKWKEG